MGLAAVCPKSASAGFQYLAPFDHIVNILFNTACIQYFYQLVPQQGGNYSAGGTAAAGFINKEFREIQYDIGKDIPVFANDNQRSAGGQIFITQHAVKFILCQ